MYIYNIYLLNTLRKKREREREIQRKSFADCFFYQFEIIFDRKIQSKNFIKIDLPIIFS